MDRLQNQCKIAIQLLKLAEEAISLLEAPLLKT